jgi:hypothetical protein
MPRTTVNIDAPILRDLKRLQKKQGRPLGRIISELLAQALSRHEGEPEGRRPLEWYSQPMRLRIDLTDKDALYTALEESSAGPGSA